MQRDEGKVETYHDIIFETAYRAEVTLDTAVLAVRLFEAVETGTSKLSSLVSLVIAGQVRGDLAYSFADIEGQTKRSKRHLIKSIAAKYHHYIISTDNILLVCRTSWLTYYAMWKEKIRSEHLLQIFFGQEPPQLLCRHYIYLVVKELTRARLLDTRPIVIIAAIYLLQRRGKFRGQTRYNYERIVESLSLISRRVGLSTADMLRELIRARRDGQAS